MAKGTAAPRRTLSAREREVAALVAEGKSNRAISQTLYVSERTVEHHVSSILNKLNVHSRVELMATMLGPAPAAAVDAGERSPRALRVIGRLRAGIRRATWFATAPRAAARRRREVLPRPPTETIGRDAEIARVIDEVGTSRFVTVTGPGGVGKSRVAIEAAFALRTRNETACAFVDLAACRSYDDVLDAIAASCEVSHPGSDDILAATIAALGEHEVLVLVDNCEHVRAHVAAIVRSLVAATPSTKLLLTSRRPMGLPGERIVRIDALPTESAVALFAARARECSGLVLDDASRELSVRLCRALDGLPLALEMAAVKTSALTVGQLLAYEHDRLRLLTVETPATPHQRSLQASVDWSYQLLTPREQTLFRALPALGTDWTIEDAPSVGDGESRIAVLEDLISLADQSLIVRIDRDGTPHFHLPETFRLFAAERAAESAVGS